MRKVKSSQPLVAGLLAVAMVLSITGLLGAAGTSIKITSPKAGARVSGLVEVSASIGSDARLTYVILGVDDDRPYSSNSAPYVFEVDTRTLTDGPHRVYVEAYDRYGLVGSSKTVTIYVKNGSASVVQAKKQPAARVAVKPAPKPPARAAAVAKAEPAAEAVASAEAARGGAAASPAMSARGPLPEPNRTAAEPKMVAARPSLPDSQPASTSASGTMSGTPPRPAVSRTRGHTVVLNGHPVVFDVAPYIEDSRMQVGFRAMFEGIGARVSWVPETRTATSVSGATQVEVPIGKSLARINGKEVEMATAAKICNGRTMVPVRFFASATASAVYWDSETRTASVQMKSRAIAERAPANQ